MKKLWGLILFIFLIFSGNCNAAQFNFLVIPDDLFLNQRDYLVFPMSATVISTEIVNYYNKHPQMSAVPVSQLRAVLNRPENERLKKETQKFLTNYQNNYVIDFNTVQKLASKFRVKQVLLITCNMDAQNYITRRTLWDFLDIPGATVIDPAFRLSTHINLIDSNNQIVLWQNTYQKLISSRESRIIPQSFGNSGEQLEKVKKYTIKFLAPQVVQETQLALLNMSPYQDLNLHPEIVKPQYVSIDKVKIDSKRATVRSANYTKAKAIEAGQAIATETNKQKTNLKTKIQAWKATQAEKKLLKEKQQSLPIEEQVKIIQEQERAKLQAKLEKQKQKQQIKDAKREVQIQLKLEEDKLNPKKSSKKAKVKEKVTEPVQQPVQEPVQNINTVPSSTIMQQNYKPTPYLRTKPVLRDENFTINDY